MTFGDFIIDLSEKNDQSGFKQSHWELSITVSRGLLAPLVFFLVRRGSILHHDDCSWDYHPGAGNLEVHIR